MPKPKKTKNAPEWKSLPDAEKAQYLLDHQTISDRTWTEESRLREFGNPRMRWMKASRCGSRWAIARGTFPNAGPTRGTDT